MSGIVRHIQGEPQLFEQLEFFHGNRSCKIEWCGNKMHQIIQIMILTPGLELKLSLLQDNDQVSILYFTDGEKVCETLLLLYFNEGRRSNTFSHL